MSEGGVLLGVFRFFKTLLGLSPNSLHESRDLRAQIEEEKRTEEVE